MNAKIVDFTGIATGRVGLGKVKTGRMGDDLRIKTGKERRVEGRSFGITLPEKMVDFIAALRD